MGDLSSPRIESIPGREREPESDAPDRRPRKPRLKPEEEKPKPQTPEEDFAIETAEEHDLDEMA